MDKIYDDAKDKKVRSTLLYVTTDDGYVYSDTAHTNKVNKTDLKEAFLKGLLVVYNGAYYTIAKFYENTTDGYAVITVQADAADYNFYSSEHVNP